VRILVIGELVVVGDNDAVVPVPGAKERLLLGVLAAAAPGVVSVDRLVDVLRDGEPPVTARKSLQAHVVRLRSALEPERPKGSTGRYVARRGPGYVLTVGPDAIDAHRVGDLVARGRARLSSGDPAGAVRQLTDALDSWRGEPYADWPDAAFADIERRLLAEVRASAVAGLLEARLALGRHAEVVPDLERLVAEEPLREGWWRLLMLALYRDGRQSDALAAGRRVRTVLADEVGADPGPGLREIERAILEQDPVLDLPVQRTSSQSGPTLVEPPGGQSTRPSGVCPYMGLAAYQRTDALLFPRSSAPRAAPGPLPGRHAATGGVRTQRGGEVLVGASGPGPGALAGRSSG
jgi:DNA-binding SARP family transcriptional activator